MNNFLFSIFWIAVVSAVKCSVLRYNLDTNCTQFKNHHCVKVRNCPYIFNLLKESLVSSLQRSALKILKKRQCGFSGSDPLFCCAISQRQHKIVDRNGIPTPPPFFDVSNGKSAHLLPTEECGKTPKTSFRKVRGIKTEVNEFPWMALLIFHENNKIEFKCAGTIINNFYVLTAAHCVYKHNVVAVRLGEHNFVTDQDCKNGYCAPPVQDVAIEEVIVHQNFSVKDRTNDIALIKLKSSARFCENVQPICLPVGKNLKLNLSYKFLTVSGWGITNNSQISSTLSKTWIPIVPLEICKKIYKNVVKIYQAHICAGGEKGQDSCKGDSGGPLKYLVVDENEISRYVQYGIVSYGPKICGLNKVPSVYTNVAHYIKWILEVIYRSYHPIFKTRMFVSNKY